MSAEPRAQTLLDALHAEMLIGVIELKESVEGLRTSFPSATQELIEASERVATAGAKACTEFQAMGLGLMAATRKEVSEERRASLADSQANARATKQLLGEFTKFFWLLTALNIVGTLSTLALLAAKLFGH